MVRAFPRAPCTQTTSVTRRNHATGGAARARRCPAAAEAQRATLRQIGRASVRSTWLNNASQAPTLVTALPGGIVGVPFVVAGALAGGLADVSVALLIVMSAGTLRHPRAPQGTQGWHLVHLVSREHSCQSNEILPLTYPDASWSHSHQRRAAPPPTVHRPLPLPNGIPTT